VAFLCTKYATSAYSIGASSYKKRSKSIPSEHTPQLSFQDSEVHSVCAQAGTLTITFAAASIQLPDGRQGYLPALPTTLHTTDWNGTLADCLGRLRGGSLWTDGTRQTTLPLPCSTSGLLRLELQFANGAQLTAHARSIHCPWPGEERFRESLAC
jgi:hypothetical protein